MPESKDVLFSYGWPLIVAKQAFYLFITFFYCKVYYLGRIQCFYFVVKINKQKQHHKNHYLKGY